MISRYWESWGKTEDDKKHGKTFSITTYEGTFLMCDECCNKDRCEDDCRRYYRPECPFCLGTAYNRTADEENNK